MEKEKMLRKIDQQQFCVINGKILRGLNILKKSERKLSNLLHLLDLFDVDDVKLSLSYLENSGYITIEHSDGADCIDDLSKYDMYKVSVNLTAAGQELLVGIKDNPAVEV